MLTREELEKKIGDFVNSLPKRYEVVVIVRNPGSQNILSSTMPDEETMQVMEVAMRKFKNRN